MPAELGGSQISSLLETLPGIASVLRSPVADALVKAIRGAVGLGEFEADDAEELIRYAVRRGLIDAVEAATERELVEQDWLRRTADFQEGIKAMADRRLPDFRGR